MIDDVVKQLLVWKRESSEIVLGGDFNDDVYRGRLAK